jgi:hypothetical protein
MNLIKTADENMNLLTQVPSGEAQGVPQFGQVMTTQVAKLHRLQVVPDAFVRVQLRRITGQTFQVKAVGSALSKEVLNRLSMMGGQSIPNEQQLARNLAQQVTQKAHDRGRLRPCLGPSYTAFRPA